MTKGTEQKGSCRDCLAAWKQELGIHIQSPLFVCNNQSSEHCGHFLDGKHGCEDFLDKNQYVKV